MTTASPTAPPAPVHAAGHWQCGVLTTDPGELDRLASVLLEAASLVSHHPGCLRYEILRPAHRSDRLWVLEAWTDRKAQQTSLEDPTVRALIDRAVPLLTSIPTSTDLEWLGGHARQ